MNIPKAQDHNGGVGYLNLENFLWLQTGFVVFGIFYLLRRGRTSSTRLRWKKSTPRAVPQEFSRQPESWVSFEGRSSSSAAAHHPPPGERRLNVHFNYNGHSWDAYEVLGLPAGSALGRVEEAYNKICEHADQGSKEFYSHAFQAIRKQTF